MSDFGKAQLLKYGWSEGKGLGKNENGIAEALKPKLKFDTAGIGHKHTEYDWWNSVYDKALNNVVLEKKGDDISINVAKENAFNISSNKSGIEFQKKQHNTLHYGKFLKTSTLQDGNMIRDNNCEVIEDDIKDDPTVIKLTDEELFKACSGRTAHKGARHGLNLSGKLRRIAEQERQFLFQTFPKTSETTFQYAEIKQKKKKKRKKDSMETDEKTLISEDTGILDKNNCLVPPLISETEEKYVPCKKLKKKVKRKIHDLTHLLNKSCTIQDDSTHGEEEKPQKKQKLCNDTCLEGTIENKKKKSKRKRGEEIINAHFNDDYHMNNKSGNKIGSSVPNSDYISDDHDCLVIPPPIEQNCKPSKKSLRKVKRKIHDLTHQLNKSCMIQDDSADDDEKKSTREKIEEDRKVSKQFKSKCKKKSKEKRDQETKSNFMYDDDDDDDVPMEPCNKKLRKSDTDSSEVFCDVELSDDSSERGHRKNACHFSKKHKFTYCPNTEAKRLNEKIRLKKIKKLQRKERKRGGGIIVEESTSSESDIKESKPSRKKYKKNKKKTVAVESLPLREH